MSAGGKREGSGRHKLPDDKKKVNLNVKIDSEAAELLAPVKNKSCYVNGLIKRDNMKLNKEQILGNVIGAKEVKTDIEHYIEVEILKTDGRPSRIFYVHEDGMITDTPAYYSRKGLTWNFAKSLLK